MSDRLASLSELLDASNPTEWAVENLRFLGAGETSAVFAHPDREDLVVRISDAPDGGFGYAEWARAEADAGGTLAAAIARHAPAVHDFAVRDDGEDGHWYFGIAERLGETDERPEVRRLLGTAYQIATARVRPCEDPDDRRDVQEYLARLRDYLASECRISEQAWAEFMSAQPAFPLFAQALTSEHRDLRPSNWMLRGNDIVLNDPIRFMSPAQDDDFRARHLVVPAPALVR